jgi:hypothetical protein
MLHCNPAVNFQPAIVTRPVSSSRRRGYYRYCKPGFSALQLVPGPKAEDFLGYGQVNIRFSRASLPTQYGEGGMANNSLPGLSR